MKNNRLTITEIAKEVGVTPRTIMRWEKAGKIRKCKRDWRGWRIYFEEDVGEIKKFCESFYDYSELHNGNDTVSILKKTLIIPMALATSLLSSIILCGSVYADANTSQEKAISETPNSISINLDALPAIGTPPASVEEEVKYILGPNDVISLDVRRHPEFTGKYTINSEGKIEYKYIGDIIVNGLTKKQLKERLTGILSEYIIDPEINIQILAYLSKVYYVVGEVYKPGKYYMKGNTMPVREALMQAGLPTLGAAMRRCRLITPDIKVAGNYLDVNIYKLLYEGDLKCNLDMKPGDVLYVPSTVMAKVIHVISPVTGATSQATRAAVQGASAAAVVVP